ncbi:hypothetical protein BLNAU_5067 [Blattamonas nauphoetae]|uniref:H15 domain-containing protein n=1 Tax=Blattamonas nauphoetae TaxID=2049346 RepID=A0ABQ9Y842_9EUKA|nr:hypothetical protein BLNAU_5067 [Blattamonas nauphoetae]
MSEASQSESEHSVNLEPDNDVDTSESESESISTKKVSTKQSKAQNPRSIGRKTPKANRQKLVLMILFELEHTPSPKGHNSSSIEAAIKKRYSDINYELLHSRMGEALERLHQESLIHQNKDRYTITAAGKSFLSTHGIKPSRITQQGSKDGTPGQNKQDKTKNKDRKKQRKAAKGKTGASEKKNAKPADKPFMKKDAKKLAKSRTKKTKGRFQRKMQKGKAGK